MARIISILTLVFTIQLSVAQKKYDINIEFSPSTKYTTNLVTSSVGEMNFAGDEMVMEKIKGEGMELPMKFSQKMDITTSMVTDSLKSEDAMPMTMTYDHMLMEMVMMGKPSQQEIPLNKMMLKGTIQNKNEFVLDSIVGDSIDPYLKSTLTTVFESFQNQLIIRNEKLAIGESFEHNVPMSIPMQGMPPMELNVTSKYTLTSVEGDIANFDVLSAVTLTTENENMKMSASGSGKGVAKYSFSKKFLTAMDLDLPMKMGVKVSEQLEISMQMKSKTVSSTYIE